MAVTPAQIAVALRRTVPEPGSPEYEQWLYWINSANMLIAARLGDVSLLDQERLDYVVTEAVSAVARRPEDYLQIDTQVDDGRISKRYETSKGRVDIIDEWWSLLSPATRKGKAFSIDTFPASWGGPSGFSW